MERGRAADGSVSGKAQLAALQDQTPSARVHLLAQVAVGTIAGCSGATASFWADGKLVCTAATHPDLAALLNTELDREGGPVHDAVTIGRTIGCDDIADNDDPKWAQYALSALLIGVRSSATVVHEAGRTMTTLTLYGVRPRAITDDSIAAASSLTAAAGDLLAQVEPPGSRVQPHNKGTVNQREYTRQPG